MTTKNTAIDYGLSSWSTTIPTTQVNRDGKKADFGKEDMKRGGSIPLLINERKLLFDAFRAKDQAHKCVDQVKVVLADMR